MTAGCKRSSGFIFDFRSSVLAVAPEANKRRTSSTALQHRQYQVRETVIHTLRDSNLAFAYSSPFIIIL